MSPDWALDLLIEGNERFVANKSTHPHQTIERRVEMTQGQHPFAVVLACSDSRVSPEIVFDRGLGDIFVVRTAGNLVDDIALGSIEYATEHLGASLIMVMGHSKCGAVTAAVQSDDAPGHVGNIIKAIKLAVEKAKGQQGNQLDNSIRANIQIITDLIATCEPILCELVKEGHVKVVGAHYDIDTNGVTVYR